MTVVGLVADVVLTRINHRSGPSAALHAHWADKVQGFHRDGIAVFIVKTELRERRASLEFISGG
eukprot:877450-Heterocapsa_arctica.AAC.1